MVVLEGKAAFQGIAIGKITEFKKESGTVRRERVQDTEAELKRLEAAKEQASKELNELYQKALTEVGEANAAIFEVHQMMMEDGDYLDSITNIIRSQEVNAEYAVAATGDNFAKMFSEMDDDYMRERAADIRDISDRLIRMLDGGRQDMALSEPGIIVADDLSPSETVQMDKSRVLAFITRRGSTNSHTAILARTMNIPAVVKVPAPEGISGKLGIVDGKAGRFIIEPDEETLRVYEERLRQEKEQRELLLKLKGKKPVTLSGREIKLYANIGGVGDVGAALQNDAEGIGLFRSEFLYLEKEDYPTEEEQFQAYKTVAEMMAGRRVIVRTLDIGADKQIGYFGLEKEENPAMGLRAVRICLTREEIFRTQLRALCRASGYGKISIMVPMIASVWEVQKVRELLDDVKEELTAGGIPVGEIEFGIMIETPAAVMISDELAKYVDFFSIGTNDLTQYTLAVDRQNPNLDAFYDAHHPAVLRMIAMVAENAHKAGIWAGICGELGADTGLTQQFIDMGIDELSVAPSMLLAVKKQIRECR